MQDKIRENIYWNWWSRLKRGALTDLRKAYNYGKQLVPVSIKNEHVLKLQKKIK
jgi:hypothetical protein